MPPVINAFRSALLVYTLIFLAACDRKQDEQQRGGEHPPTPVSVVEVKPETLPVVSELPGRISPMIIADIRPRVSGLVLRRVFEQGTVVNKGDLLYQIDPAPFQATVDSAQAALAVSLAAQKLASQTAERQTQLQKTGAVSAEARDTAVSNLAQSNADVARAHANLRSAQLELQYTEIKAPISGSIGRALITEGMLVSPTSDIMATIQQIDPIYADFTQSADTQVLLRNAINEGKLKANTQGSTPITLITEQGKTYPHDGKLLFSDTSVNAQTGQLILRAEFPNPEHNLLPGMFVRSKLQQGERKGAFAVPEQAVQRDTAGKPQLYVVNAEGRVDIRNVRLGWIVGGRWVIIEGLAPDDHVIVEGFQRIRAGVTVKPELWTGPKKADVIAKQGG